MKNINFRKVILLASLIKNVFCAESVVNEDKDLHFKILAAVRAGDQRTVKDILTHRENVNISAEDGQSIVIAAATSEDSSLFYYLLDKIKINNFPDFKKQMALRVSILHGHVELVRQCIEAQNTDPNISIGGRNALGFSVMCNEIDIVRYLVDERHLDVNYGDQELANLIKLAAIAGHTNVANYFLEEKGFKDHRYFAGNKSSSYSDSDDSLEDERYLQSVRNVAQALGDKELEEQLAGVRFQRRASK